MKFNTSQIIAYLSAKLQSCVDTRKNFSVPLNEVLDIFNVERCPYSGRKFTLEKGKINSPTFERVNPWIGYESGNVLIVTKAANQEKAQLDAFVKGGVIDYAMKVKLMRKAIYQLEKRMKEREK